jgi:hypothetical protein
MSSEQGKMWDVGEAKSRIIDDDDVMVLLPFGYAIEQRGYWYCAFLGEAWHGKVTTSLVLAVEECWDHYNGMPHSRRSVARKSGRTYGAIVEDKQSSFDDLL